MKLFTQVYFICSDKYIFMLNIYISANLPFDIVKLLLQSADKTLQDKHGKTAEMYAAELNNGSMKTLFQRFRG